RKPRTRARSSSRRTAHRRPRPLHHPAERKHYTPIARLIRSGVSGRSRSRAPVASAMALAMAAAAGPCAASPVPTNGSPPLAGAVDDVDVDPLGDAGEAHDRVARPVAAGDAGSVEAYGLVQRPARRLNDPAFDLVADAIRVHGFAAVGRRHGAEQTHASALML